MISLGKTPLLPAFGFLSFAVLTVYALSTLKPSTTPTPPYTPAPAVNTAVTPFSITDLRLISEQKQQEIEDMLGADVKSEMDLQSFQNAQILNELMLDFFTTDFDTGHQIKWQQHLAEGVPYLSTLAGYLKLEELYGIELYQEQNDLINQEYSLANLAIQRPTFFKFISYYASDFWPMSIIANAESNSHSRNLLLNNYDRDFVIMIEQNQLASSLSPLALGIERLLKYHLKQIALNGARLNRYHLTKDIDQVIAQFQNTAPQSSDVFTQYNHLIGQDWHAATEHLLNSPILNQPENEFFYDLLALYSPSSLIDQVTYAHYQQNSAWWQQFLEFELCMAAPFAVQQEVTQRLSLAQLCNFNQQMSIQPLSANSGDNVSLIIRFWNKVLSVNNLDQAYLEQYFATGSIYTKSQFASLTSHDILNGLAAANRLRIIRNDNVLKRAERNFRIWQDFLGVQNQDSFLSYSTLFQWFHQQPEQFDQSINKNLPKHLAQLGQPLKQELAKEVVMFISRGIINQQNLNQYQELLPLLSIEDQYTLARFLTLAKWPEVMPMPSKKALKDVSTKTLNEKAHRMVLESQVSYEAAHAESFDYFLINTKNIILTFHVTYPSSKTAQNSRLAFDDSGKFHDSYLRELKQVWLKRNPQSDTRTDYFDLL